MSEVSIVVNGNKLQTNRYVTNVVDKFTNAAFDSLDIDANITGTRTIIISNKELSVKIGSVDIQTNEFSTNMIVTVITAMVEQLSGYDKPAETIMITLS